MQRSELDEWVRTWLTADHDFEILAAVKFLEKCVTKEPVGNSANFYACTLMGCVEATRDVAEMILNDENSVFHHKSLALTYLLILEEGGGNNDRVDFNLLKSVVTTTTQTDHDRTMMIELVRAVIRRPTYWRRLRREVVSSVDRMMSDLDISGVNGLTSKGTVISAINAVDDFVLSRQLSHENRVRQEDRG